MYLQVYQDKLYMEDMKFNSFRKVARSLGYDENGISIVSFHWGVNLCSLETQFIASRK